MISFVRSSLYLLAVVALLVAPMTTWGQSNVVYRARKSEVAFTTGGIVTSASSAASLVGRDVLASGGNAVDAAIATGFALAVTWPEAGNIGGGGFMIVAPADGEVTSFDYRETAPGAAGPDSFVAQKNRFDSRMVGVPGTVRGFALAHQKYGSLPWKRLVQPAADLAKNGFAVDDPLADSINAFLNQPAVKQDSGKLYAETKRIYARADGRPWRAGDLLRLPDLGKTLDRIASNGPDEFYVGETADLIAAYMKNSGGMISQQDLATYQAAQRQPIVTEFRGNQVYGMPPPSSGGISIALALAMFDQFDIEPPTDQAWSADNLHIIAEAMRRAFRERAAHLGDADFVEIPPHLIDPKQRSEFAAGLAETIDLKTATPSQNIAGDIELKNGPYESEQTTHFSVVDQNGMAVSNTYTLEASWGARVVPPGTGIVLNNEMGDFNWFPGYTNRQGGIGTKANRIEPGKRMLSSMAPTIVKRDGKVVLVTGSPGGRTIINTVLCILIQRLAFDRSLQGAVDAPRLHHQWFPDAIRLEATTFPNRDQFSRLHSALKDRGHVVRPSGIQGASNSISIDVETGVRTGVADFRRGGGVMVTR